jgi:hypothetical protein
LDIAGGNGAVVSQAVAVLDRPRQHVGDGFDSAVRMPGKSGQVIRRILVAEIVKQQKWIEIFRFAEAKGALEFNPGALDGGFRLNDLSDWTE